MSAGADVMARMIERARALRTLETDIAQAARGPVEDAARATAGAGTTPDGSAWAARKDGGRALAKAAEGVFVRVVGATLQVVCRAPYVFHQKSRQVIPSAGDDTPSPMAAAIKRAAVAAFQRATS